MINNIIRSATRDSKKHKIRCLTFCRENEMFLDLLSKCNCEIYVVPKEGISNWKPSICKIPKNVFPLRHEGEITNIPYVDCVIINDRLQEWDIGKSISQSLHVPTVVIDHVSREGIQKLPIAGSVSVQAPLEIRNGDINVCLSEKIKESWGSQSHISVVIPPHVKDGTADKEKSSVVIDNNLPADILTIVESFVKEFEPVPRFPESDLNNLKSAKVYLNTWNSIDLKTLQAMSAGCITISARTLENISIIEHEKNGLLFSDMSQIPEMVRACLNGEYDQIQQESKKTVAQICCDEKSFVKKWNRVFSYISESFFVRN